MPKRIFLAFISIIAASAVMAQAYRWVDEDGVVHYSDLPHEGAERIDLSAESRRPRPVAAARAAPTRAAATEQEKPAAPFRYQTLIINAPAAEQTLWNIEGVLNVSLDLRPALQPGHEVRVYFDGEARTVSGLNFQIEEVYRGVHNLQAEVIDETGRLMIRSLPNRFYVQQHSIAN
jgi:hypothetical protein